MAAQTSYAKEQVVALNGQVAHDFGTADIVSRVVEDAAGLGFGLTVSKGTTEDSIVAGNANVIGIVTRSAISFAAAETRVDIYAQKDSAPVLRKGYIFVTNTGTAVAQGDTAAFTAAGQLSATGTTVAGITVERDTAQNAIALLRVNL